MEEHRQHDNGGHGSAQSYEATVQSDARAGEDLREELGRGRVGTFEAEAKERGENVEARGGDGKEPLQDRDSGRVGTFDMKPEERGKNVEAPGRKIQAALSDLGQSPGAGHYLDAWPRQVAGFYGRRLRKNVEFGRRFAKVEGVADLLRLQREYVSDMLLDYASSFYSLYGIGLRAPQQPAEGVNRQ